MPPGLWRGSVSSRRRSLRKTPLRCGRPGTTWRNGLVAVGLGLAGEAEDALGEDGPLDLVGPAGDGLGRHRHQHLGDDPVDPAASGPGQQAVGAARSDAWARAAARATRLDGQLAERALRRPAAGPGHGRRGPARPSSRWRAPAPRPRRTCWRTIGVSRPTGRGGQRRDEVRRGRPAAGTSGRCGRARRRPRPRPPRPPGPARRPTPRSPTTAPYRRSWASVVSATRPAAADLADDVVDRDAGVRRGTPR